MDTKQLSDRLAKLSEDDPTYIEDLISLLSDICTEYDMYSGLDKRKYGFKDTSHSLRQLQKIGQFYIELIDEIGREASFEPGIEELSNLVEEKQHALDKLLAIKGILEAKLKRLESVTIQYNYRVEFVKKRIAELEAINSDRKEVAKYFSDLMDVEKSIKEIRFFYSNEEFASFAEKILKRHERYSARVSVDFVDIYLLTMSASSGAYVGLKFNLSSNLDMIIELLDSVKNRVENGCNSSVQFFVLPPNLSADIEALSQFEAFQQKVSNKNPLSIVGIYQSDDLNDREIEFGILFG